MHDPLVDPQPGDIVSKPGQRREVVEVVRGDIYYLRNGGKKRCCWISTWQEWCKGARAIGPIRSEEVNPY